MERLTKWIDDGEKRQAIPDPEIRSNGHGKCCNKLAALEDLEEQGLLLRLPYRESEEQSEKRSSGFHPASFHDQTVREVDSKCL